MTRHSSRWRLAHSFAAVAAFAAAGARAQVPPVCDQYAGDPAQGSVAWTQRDANNVDCGYQRHRDAQESPAFLAKDQAEVAIAQQEFATVTAPEWAADPIVRLHANCCTTPDSKVGDPFRSPEEWAAAGRGRHLKFYFINSNGAKLRARLFAPIDQTQTYPALTFTPGLQSYNEVNAWFPEEMAEAGYVVLIIDPQAQGDSESCGHTPDGTQTSCPQTDQPTDTRSAIDFVLSTPANPYPWALGVNAAGTPTYNPFWEAIDQSIPIGIAGHSLGAIAVTPIGQENDPRIGAVISYDNLDANLPNDAQHPLHTPSLYFSVDYPFPQTPTPMSSNPDPTQHLVHAYSQLVAAGVDAMAITLRASDHYEFGYQPYPANFPSSRYGERVTLYYSLAWFDRYVKHDTSATLRLVRSHIDPTADLHSIGAGTYDAAQAAANPTDPFAGNVPYQIADKCVANLLSFYYHSAYDLEGGALATSDMRAKITPECLPEPALGGLLAGALLVAALNRHRATRIVHARRQS
jgi:hypothetical protein